MANEPSAER